jgi:NDP-sugar pyrophosphorylase family protein
MDLTLVALAAGVGKRYGGLKQLEPIGPQGETLLEYSVFDALRAGFSRVVLVVRPETEDLFRDAFAQGMAKRVPLTYVHQTLTELPASFELLSDRSKPWGTGQAILVTEVEIDGPFVVVNADDFYGAESFVTLSRFFTGAERAEVTTFAMLGFAVGQTLTEAGPVSRALCRLDEEGRLQRIIEIARMWKHNGGGVYRDAAGREVEVPGGTLASMNIWGFTPDLFPELNQRFGQFLADRGDESESEFLIPEVIQALVREGRIRVEVLKQAGQWCGITFPEDKERVAKVISDLVCRGVYPPALWA